MEWKRFTDEQPAPDQVVLGYVEYADSWIFHEKYPRALQYAEGHLTDVSTSPGDEENGRAKHIAIHCTYPVLAVFWIPMPPCPFRIEGTN